ncbi:MAG: hypothetical protein K9N07_03735 [Candidatus Cloacimonetes bacterium]|nr:hypothetical protein [Candidatus Cloacimonadota bacterium]
MKYKFTFLLVIILLSTKLFSWGALGHKLITRLAILDLPKEMQFFKENNEYLSSHSKDADLRKEFDLEESHKHYIDIDYYKEFIVGKMITDKTKLIDLYGEEVVDDMGILPWNTLEVLDNLIRAMQFNDKVSILYYAADLAHYVGDAHQPQHNILNYNGKLTDQKGIHKRYETDIINSNEEELTVNIKHHSPTYFEDPLKKIFDYCTQANSFAVLIEQADLYALELSNNEYNDQYYNIFWFRTKYMTFHQFSSAIEDLTSLLYTAWIDAGKPDIK